MCLKGHSQLWDRADLDASFVNFEKRLPQPEIKVRVEYIQKSASIFFGVLLDFQSFTRNRFVSMLLLIL